MTTGSGGTSTDGALLAAATDALAGRVPEVDPATVGLLVGLARLARVNDAVLARLAAGHDLGPSDTSVLVALWLAGPPHRLSPTELGRILVQTSGGMTATLRRLHDRGFVARVPDPDDGRRLDVELTRRGRQVGLAAFDDMASHYAATFAELSPDERADLDRAVRTIVSTLERRAGVDVGPVPDARAVRVP